mmetsp:Transcript_25883/g.83842  ORF Transcript_25883/g.83842 Transcript_25883/m.83842 type:complete len:317 (+) Transcript_25883:146-1096(+)
MGWGVFRTTSSLALRWIIVVLALTTATTTTSSPDRCTVCQRVAERTIVVYEQLKLEKDVESPQESALSSACDALEGTRFEGYFPRANVTTKACEDVVDVVEGSLAAMLEREAYAVAEFGGAASMLRAHFLTCDAVCPRTFLLSSPAAGNRTALPDFTLCDGAKSPEIEWIGAPEGTSSYAVSFRPIRIAAGVMPEFLWLGWDITKTALRRGEAAPAEGVPYRGPCPSREKTGYRLEVLAIEGPPDLLQDAATEGAPHDPETFYLATRGRIIGIAFLDFVANPKGAQTPDDPAARSDDDDDDTEDDSASAGISDSEL